MIRCIINFYSQPKSNTFGGPFICAHLRRRDFLWARPKETPSLEWAAKQIIDLMKTLKLHNLFISTDAPNEGKKYFII